ncbi:MAG: pantoate--beta-alanine ligase [bacterium]
MKSLKTIAAARRWRKGLNGQVVLVPTMGALHSGHEALIKHARKIAGPAGFVVVSIFVNPTQFGPKEDFKAYPRPLSEDLSTCRRAGADAVLLPTPEEMYASDASVCVTESRLSSTLCGRSRPGHFSGVCTVVAKFFLIIRPTHAVFGEKDWQQLAVIRRMVRDLNFPIIIEPFPTFREVDGLAASSRNTYLTRSERALAPRIHAAMLAASEWKSPTSIIKCCTDAIARIPGARVDYIEAVDASTLETLRNRKKEGRLAVAVFLGKARLIDNIPLPLLP